MMTTPNPKVMAEWPLHCLPEGMGEGFVVPSPTMVHLGGCLHEAG
jgi:hypothetical protein